ncbi:phytoene desaturase family protein [Acidobacteriota bacterium]
MEYGAVIIGAGLGGLTAGAKLAREGRKVLLIEQREVPGGCATTFRRKDYSIEASLHGFYGLDDKDLSVKIFNELEVFKNVEFVKAPDLYRFSNGRHDIVLPNDYREVKKILVDRFPEEEAGIHKFFNALYGIREETKKLPTERWKMILRAPLIPFKYRNVTLGMKNTVGSFLDKVFRNDDLKLILTPNISAYHDDPYALPLAFFAIGQAKLFWGGAHFIKGGSQKLSEHFVRFIEANGGKVILGHLVTKIIKKGKRAIGIEFRETEGRTKDTQEAFGKVIIANAPIPNVVNELLPAEAGESLRVKTKDWEIAPSVLAVYYGFKKSLRRIGNGQYCTFIYDEGVRSLKDIRSNCRGDWRKRHYSFCDYSQIDSGLASEEKGVGVLLTAGNLADWEALGDEEYKSRKAEVAQIFTDRLNKLIPGCSDEVDVCEVGTPRTIRRLTLNPGGTPMGYAQIPQQAVPKRVGRRSPVDSLYFASAWTAPGGSFPAVIEGGYYCAVEAMKDHPEGARR